MIQYMDQIAGELISQNTYGLITKAIGVVAGNERLYVNIDQIPPGSLSTKYHSHPQQEGSFLVLSGDGTMRLNDRGYPVTKGDFLAKPFGQNIVHSIYNFGDTDLILLGIGMIEQEDTCYYSDEDMHLLKSNGQRRTISGSDFNNEWATGPNADEVGDTL